MKRLYMPKTPAAEFVFMRENLSGTPAADYLEIRSKIGFEVIQKISCILLLTAAFGIALGTSNSAVAQVLNRLGEGSHTFGDSVSVFGNIGFVGAWGEVNNGVNGGSAYVFRNLDNTTGTVFESARLVPSVGEIGGRFGFSVSLSNAIGLIGASSTNGQGTSSGSAYVYRNLDSASGLIAESAKLVASDATESVESRFGEEVSISGNIGVVGALGDDENGSNSGAAYVFRNLDNATGTINESVKLKASDPNNGFGADVFGEAVSISRNTALVGALGDDDNGNNSGSAYVFRNLNIATGTINESVKLVASNGASSDHFGDSVSLSSNIGLVGARNADDPGFNSGKAYVFQNLDTASGTINESAELIASDSQNGDQFGTAVSISGNIGIVGAPLTDMNPNDNLGSVYVFHGLDSAIGTLNETIKIRESISAGLGRFGLDVDFEGDRFAVGTNGDDVYTGTVSSMTTLDAGNVSAVIDGISFESRTNWIIGESTSNNIVTLTESDSGRVSQSGAGIYIGANSGSNDNTLVLEGIVTTNDVWVGAEGNFGNTLFLVGNSDIDSITLAENNSLLLPGEFDSFSLLNSELDSDLFVLIDGTTELITEDNFESLLSTNFNNATGISRLTAISSVPEPSAVSLLGVIAFAGFTRRRRRQQLK